MKIIDSSTKVDSVNAYPSNEKENSVDQVKGKKEDKIHKEDQIFLSDKAKRLQEKEQLVKDIQRQVDEISSSNVNPYDELMKCLQIASRIIKGDKVPQADLNFLMEHQPDLYSATMLMKQNKEKPKNHKSLVDEENQTALDLESLHTELDAIVQEIKVKSEE